MIATIKVLGLRARDVNALAAAARRVVEYVQGGPIPSDPAGLAGYYADQHADWAGAGGRPVRGRPRGRAAGLVGLQGDVSAVHLERLLLGRHARTGAALVPARGSAGRAREGVHVASPEFAEVPEVLSLAQAARIAGVSPTYLRRLAENTALTAAVEAPPAGPTGQVAGQAEPLPGLEQLQDGAGEQDRLRAFRDPVHGRRWLVDKQELARFMTDRQPPTVVIGFDLTCSAPKSVSLLWAFGDEQTRDDITAALDSGVDAALAYLERHGVVGTVAGRNRPGSGLAVASYRHEISRSEEAHLHAHNIIVNAVPVPVVDETGQPVLDADGVAVVQWRTLDSEVLLRHVRTAGFVGAAALRHELSRRRGLEWAPVRNGVAELAAFPRGLLEAFSTRAGEVHEEFAQLVDAGFAPDLATKNAAQRGSRAAKRVLSDPQVEALQRDKLAAAGWDVEQVRALGAARAREVAAPSEAEVAALFERLVGPGGLAEQQPLFTQREVHQHIAAWAVDRLAPDQIAGLAQRFLADPRIVSVAAKGRRRRNGREDTYTTSELLETEDSLVALYRQGRTDHAAIPRALVEPVLVEQAIAEVSEQLRTQTGDPAAALSGEQGDLVRALLSSGDLVRLVVGPAGTGKTEAMRALTAALAAAGHTVYGTANGGRQAQELTERIGITSQVVTSWLTRLDHVADPATVWRPGTVLILDEATQVSTRDAERLLRYATRTATAVILIGDPAQLGSVGAGGWFAHLVRTAGPDHVTGLSINQRQTGPHLATVREALELLRVADPAADQQALQHLADDGRLQVFTSRQELLAAIVQDWYAERQPDDADRTGGVPRAGSPQSSPAMSPPVSPESSPDVADLHGASAADLANRSRMTAEHHRDAELLNRAARARLAADGVLTGPTLHVAGRAFQVGDEVITLTQAGHTLVPIGRPASDYIRTGTIGIVTAVHAHDDAHDDRADRPDQLHRPQTHHLRQVGLTVQFPGHGEVHVGWDYLTHAFPDGRDGGLGHGYALTAHKAEGSTMPTARPALADDTSRAGLYVMLSRAKHDLRGYLIHRPALDANPDDEDWLPVIPDTDPAVRSLLDHLAAGRPERLAGEHDPVAHAAHRLSLSVPLHELTQGRRANHTGSAAASFSAALTGAATTSDGPLRPGAETVDAPAMVVRRAELAAEQRVGQAAVAQPSPELLARIGPRPAAGAHLALWERAVRALAVFHHRYQPYLPPDLPAHQLPAFPPDVPDDPEVAWAQGRAEAERIIERWAATLAPAQQRRFHTQQEAVPRDRATAGIHALLDAGWAPNDLSAALTQHPLSDDGQHEGPQPRTADIRAGAAVLEHRVHRLLEHSGVEPGLHHVPGPATPQQEWQQATDLLAAAEARHLANRPTAQLAAEHRLLSRLLTGSPQALPPAETALGRSDRAVGPTSNDDFQKPWHEAQVRATEAAAVCAAARNAVTAVQQRSNPAPGVLRAVHDRYISRRQQLADAQSAADTAASYAAAVHGDPEALSQLRSRLHRIDAAIAHQIDEAAARLAWQPAAYLTGLLGHPPTDPGAARDWRRRAVAVEHYRHHELGLPYGTAAADASASAVQQAIGAAPPSGAQRAHYDQLRDTQPVLDLGAAL